jgi:hypothetical protein
LYSYKNSAQSYENNSDRPWEDMVTTVGNHVDIGTLTLPKSKKRVLNPLEKYLE